MPSTTDPTKVLAAHRFSDYCSASPHFTADPGEQAVPQLHFTPTRVLPAFSTGLPLPPRALLPTGERCREGAGVPWPSPREFTPTSPAIVIQLLGYGTVETQISGLASRLRNLSPGSPPIIGTQIGRHCEQIAGIKEEAVSGASWGHSSARAMHYLL